MMMDAQDTVYVAIEGGGTKFVVGIGASAERCTQTVIETRSADETMDAVKQFIGSTVEDRAIAAIGVAAFGPVQIDPSRHDCGEILETPKPGWAGYNYIQDLGAAFGAPVGVTTDVNAAALAEKAARPGCNHLAYITIGTGIGVGIINSGNWANGGLHPEIGHICLPRHELDAEFAGICPFHGDCLEGLAAGPAIKARWGVSLSELPLTHPAHDIEARYLGQLCANIFLHHMPEFIVLGGGVSNTPGLIERVRLACAAQLNGYLPGLKGPDAFERAICSPISGPAAGLSGAFLLAEQTAIEDSVRNS